ncbi:SprT family protein [Enterococcus timonensis]|uniref:SprT family protein n=1 Tax=Enterococcus timonensis TaxID=1852364 RepID=UPI0008D9DA24|nr:SprT family protein [Enterococcus timonensis]
MTNQQLQALVEEISLSSFHQPFVHQAIFNSRLKTTGGRYHLKDHHLDFNPLMLDYGQEVFANIIKHELCHYHLHLAKKGYQHKDADFKWLLKEVGGLRFAPRSEKSTPTAKKNHYICTSCAQEYWRVKQINTKRYVCGRCHGLLKKCS